MPNLKELKFVDCTLYEGYFSFGCLKKLEKLDMATLDTKGAMSAWTVRTDNSHCRERVNVPL